MNVQFTFNENKKCQLCVTLTDSILNEKLYTRKELVTMGTSIVEFHQLLEIPAMQKLAYHLPHVLILVTYHCGNTQ